MVQHLPLTIFPKHSILTYRSKILDVYGNFGLSKDYSWRGSILATGVVLDAGLVLHVGTGLCVSCTLSENTILPE